MVRFVAATFISFSVLGGPPTVHAQSVTPGCLNDRYGNVQCPSPGGSCLLDLYGDVRCSPPDGGILLDRYKRPVCGPGACIVDRLGEVRCSSVAKGSAALERGGDAVCTEGCVAAAASSCLTPAR